MISTDLTLKVQAVVEAERCGRLIYAALGLTVLREHYEALDPETLAPDEQSWQAFADKHIALPSHRVHELIGSMVHRGAVLCCTKCNAKVKNPCGCGVPYITGHRWEEPLPPKLTLRQRIAAAITAHPNLSDRAIAAEIGCDHKTVGRTRKTLPASPQIPQSSDQQVPA